MKQAQPMKSMTHGEAGLAAFFGASAFLCLIAAAKAVGKLVAERAKAKGIDAVLFDRGGYLYHGRVKALAEAAREAGLKF